MYLQTTASFVKYSVLASNVSGLIKQKGRGETHGEKIKQIRSLSENVCSYVLFEALNTQESKKCK